MKNYLIYFLLFSIVGFSQNYQYSLEEGKIPPPVVLPTGVNNQKEEIEYFKAYLLPLSQKANLQNALDTYGSVRLEQGDYSGVDVVLHSNQRLYGHPSLTGINSITVAQGSTNVRIEAFRASKDDVLEVNFQAGAEISNCTVKTMKFCRITGTNVRLRNTIFTDINGAIRFDCSSSGYTRNNKIIRHMQHGGSDVLVFKGNRTTPSYGNVSVHSNFLSSSDKPSTIDNVESQSFVAIDIEIYDQLNAPVISVTNVDKFKINMSMGNIYYDYEDPFMSIDATEAFLINTNNGAKVNNKLSARTNLLTFDSNRNLNKATGVENGFTFKSYTTETNRIYTNPFIFNEVEQTTANITNDTKNKLTNSILGTQYTPWERPNFETVPDPLGTNWKVERVGKPDSTTYIQNLINTAGVANLPEGVFYISSTLTMGVGMGQGITGKGTGKTVICGLTDDFPLITVNSGTFESITLSNITLQGGKVGLYVSNHKMMMTYQSLKYIVFREQESGIEMYDIYGLDNNFFEELTFVNCDKGIYTHPFIKPFNPDNLDGSTYMDKTVFYRCHFINCNTPLYLTAARACNMNAFVDCKFDGGINPIYVQGDNKFFINSDFTNFNSNYVVESNEFNFVNCKFYNNTVSNSTLYAGLITIEGCSFLDNAPLYSYVPNNIVNLRVYNSLITGNSVVADVPQAVLVVNSTLLSNPTFSKLLVSGINGKPNVLIDTPSKPYPQFLVTQ